MSLQLALSTETSKTVLDSGFPRRGFRIPGILDSLFLSVKLGFWIPILSRVPDSLSCIQGHDPFNQNSDRSDREWTRFLETFPVGSN